MFWNQFYDLCEKNKTKPLNVVKVLKIGVGSITSWKNGTTPNGETLLKIADYFNVSIDYLMGRDMPVKDTELHVVKTDFPRKYSLLTPEAKRKVNEYIEDLACNPTYTVNEITVDEIQRAIDERNKAAQNKLQIAAHGGDGVRVMKLEDFSDDMIDELIKDNERRHQK